MTSTDVNIGVATVTRPSSRVLKPPGGGHTNIFGEPELAVNAPRPKYNQQNSSNLNACLGSTDPNAVVEKLRQEITKPESGDVDAAKTETKTTPTTTTNGTNNVTENGNGGNTNGARSGRVPPGGFSSGGFW